MKKGIPAMLAETGERLAVEPLDPEVASSAARQLESCSYDLALAIIQWEEERGSTRESRMARAILQDMDGRLLWVEQNRADLDTVQMREELQAARQSAADVAALLLREGIDVPDSESERDSRFRRPG